MLPPCDPGFVWLGVLLFFDRKLIAMGDILFLAGFAFLSGFQRTIRYVAPPAQHCPNMPLSRVYNGGGRRR